jgi:hypothetical protein
MRQREAANPPGTLSRLVSPGSSAQNNSSWSMEEPSQAINRCFSLGMSYTKFAALDADPVKARTSVGICRPT